MGVSPWSVVPVRHSVPHFSHSPPSRRYRAGHRPVRREGKEPAQGEEGVGEGVRYDTLNRDGAVIACNLLLSLLLVVG